MGVFCDRKYNEKLINLMILVYCDSNLNSNWNWNVNGANRAVWANWVCDELGTAYSCQIKKMSYEKQLNMAISLWQQEKQTDVLCLPKLSDVPIVFS